MKEAIGLVDANNFYCSCERVFNARIRSRPVVVLSNNDGCIVARSNEAKAIGLKMGEPVFKARPMIDEFGVSVFSSNYTLYGDLSARMHELLAEFSPQIEKYSIDEAFLMLQPSRGQTLDSLGRAIKERIKSAIGIPVSVGIAETKTLAKVAGHFAKKSEKTKGVLNLAGSPHQRIALERLPIGEVWGVGSRYEKFLQMHGITNALQFRDAKDDWIRKNLSVVGLRTVWELRGLPCLEFELVKQTRKSLVVSRSFGEAVETIEELQNAIAHFVSRAGEKLRRDELLAGALSVWIETSRFSEDARYSNTANVCLAPMTDSTPELIAIAFKGLQTIYKKDYRYKKAGVMLSNFASLKNLPLRLWGQDDHDKAKRLMCAVDSINQRFGRETVQLGAMLGVGKWRMRQEQRSKRFTTRLDEVLTVY